jgi:hypothetical protein
MVIEFDPTTAKLRLAFAYRKDLVDLIKSFAVRQYNPITHGWLVGFDSSNVEQLFGLLSRFPFPQDMFEKAKIDALGYLAAQTTTPSAQALNEQVQPILIKLGQLVVTAYENDLVSNADQVAMLELINHLSLKDFIK